MWAQNVVGEFASLTSILNLRDLVITNDKIYAASPGGLVEFDKNTKQFYSYGLKDGLSHVDILSLALDEAGDLWLGMGAPRGEIEIWSIRQNQVIRTFGVNTFGTPLTAITAITFTGNRAYVAYQRNADWGILEFQRYGDKYEYRDFYQNFPLKFGYINDLEVWRDTLWLATNVGLLYVDINQPNLKIPDAWHMVNLPRADQVANIVDYDNQIFTTCGSEIYRVSGGSAHRIDKGVGEVINCVFITKTAQIGISTNSGVFLRDETGSWSQIGHTAVNRVKYDNEILYGGSRSAGLWSYAGGVEHNYIPNTPIDNIFTALWVTTDGNLVAGTLDGFSFQTENGWYNIKKDYQSIKIANRSAADWNYFVADTLAYSVTSRIYSLVQRRNGDFFASLYGSYLVGPKGGGLLKFNLSRLSEYTVYDTTEGRLAGSAGHGGADNYLGIAYLALDKAENLWIANQYAQNDKVVAILTPDERWQHFSIDDSHGYLNYYITAIAFDALGRVWFGSEAISGATPSVGGIIVLNYNQTLFDKSDDKWYFVSKSDGLASNSIYALAFDQEGDLWIMSAGGIQRARINTNLASRIFASIDEPVLSNLSFAKECRIRVDGLNNKWITTVDAGVKVYTYNGIWLNDVEGFTTENSSLLSNSVLDIAFYPPDGLVYFATTKGISVYKSPYANYGKRYRDLVVFPSPYKIPNQQPLVIDGLLQDSEVKIMLLDGTFIRHLTAAKGEIIGQQAFWDGKDYKGRYVSSGVYIFLAYTKEGDTTTGKLTVLRQ